VILFNITSAVYAVGLGFGQAVCTKVGNSIGKGKPQKAKNYVVIGMVLMQSINLCFSMLFFIFPELFLRIYSDNPDTIAAATKPLKIIAVGHMVDSVQLLF
jgi:Na+-driven multidrug efflux pump